MEAMRTRKVAGKKRPTLYIKNPAAHRLAEQVSQQLGVTLSDAVIGALEEKLQKTRRPLNRTKVDALCTRIGALPVVDACDQRSNSASVMKEIPSNRPVMWGR
jgi:hypothetical protein